MDDQPDAPRPFTSSQEARWENGFVRSPAFTALWNEIKASIPNLVNQSVAVDEIRLRRTTGEHGFQLSVGHLQAPDEPPSVEGPPRSGFLRSFPLYMSSELVGEITTVTRLLADGTPVLLSVMGQRPESMDRSELVVAYEWPVPYFVVPTGELAQEALEHEHYEGFRTDHLLGTGTLPYDDAKPGPNPPDIIASRDHEPIRIDCTQFTLEERRQAHGSFERLQAELLKEPRERFAHLAGYIVYMWFLGKTRDSLVRPHRVATQGRAIRSVIEALATYQANPGQLRVKQGAPLPERHPDLGEVTTVEGCRFYAVPLGDIFPPTRQFTALGFELALGFVTTHDGSAAWEQLQRLIAEHDNDDIDDLLVTVGGPNKRGLAYPSDELVIAQLLGERPESFQIPTHLSRVLLHLWSSGKIIEVFPDFRVLMQGIRPDGFLYSSFPGPLPARSFVSVSPSTRRFI